MNSDYVDGPLPPKPRNTKQVIRHTSTEKIEYCSLSRKIKTVWIHWIGRSVECSDDEHCVPCLKGKGRKWKGYLDVIVMGSPQWNAFLELTPVAWEKIEKLFDKERGLRGCRFTIAKTKGGPKGRYLVDVLERYFDMENAQEEESPMPVLRRLWAINAAKLNGTHKPD